MLVPGSDARSGLTPSTPISREAVAGGEKGGEAGWMGLESVEEALSAPAPGLSVLMGGERLFLNFSWVTRPTTSHRRRAE